MPRLIKFLGSIFIISFCANVSFAISTSELNIQLNPDKIQAMYPISKAIALQITKSDDADFDMIGPAIMEQHYRSFVLSPIFDQQNKNQDLMILAHIRFSTLLDGQDSQVANKVSYEKKLSDHHHNSLMYNSEHSTIFSPLFEGKLQCYSGTILYDLIRRTHGKKVHEASNRVFIYTNGHILPGYLKKELGVYNLYGIETTVAGKGLKKFGPVQTLKRIRVVDANLALLVELLKDSILNLQTVVQRALLLTSKKFELPLAQMEEGIENALVRFSQGNIIQKTTLAANEFILPLINSSPFGFGNSNASDSGQDLIRATVDVFPTEGTEDYNNDENIIKVAENIQRQLVVAEHIRRLGTIDSGESVIINLPNGHPSINHKYGSPPPFPRTSILVVIQGPLAKKLIENPALHLIREMGGAFKEYAFNYGSIVMDEPSLVDIFKSLEFAASDDSGKLVKQNPYIGDFGGNKIIAYNLRANKPSANYNSSSPFLFGVHDGGYSSNNSYLGNFADNLGVLFGAHAEMMRDASGLLTIISVYNHHY